MINPFRSWSQTRYELLRATLYSFRSLSAMSQHMGAPTYATRTWSAQQGRMHSQSQPTILHALVANKWHVIAGNIERYASRNVYHGYRSNSIQSSLLASVTEPMCSGVLFLGFPATDISLCQDESILNQLGLQMQH